MLKIICRIFPFLVLSAALSAPRGAYAEAPALQNVKDAVDKGDVDGALRQLDDGIKHAASPEMRAALCGKKAAILVQAGKMDLALQTVEGELLPQAPEGAARMLASSWNYVIQRISSREVVDASYERIRKGGQSNSVRAIVCSYRLDWLAGKASMQEWQNAVKADYETVANDAEALRRLSDEFSLMPPDRPNAGFQAARFLCETCPEIAHDAAFLGNLANLAIGAKEYIFAKPILEQALSMPVTNNERIRLLRTQLTLACLEKNYALAQSAIEEVKVVVGQMTQEELNDAAEYFEQIRIENRQLPLAVYNDLENALPGKDVLLNGSSVTPRVRTKKEPSKVLAVTPKIRVEPPKANVVEAPPATGAEHPRRSFLSYMRIPALATGACIVLLAVVWMWRKRASDSNIKRSKTG